MIRTLLLSLFALTNLLPSPSVFGEPTEFAAADIEYFESKIRPILASRCYECHGPKAKTLQAGLRLDSREGVLKGGDSGPAVSPGNPDESLLIQSVRWQSLEMPPKAKLPAEELAALVKWVDLGAPWPNELTTALPSAPKDYDWETLSQQHWAFRPVSVPPIPTVQEKIWPQNEIDSFVLSKLEQARLSPSPPAEPRVLVRRIYLDLIELPPTPDEVKAFVQAAETDRPAAIRTLVDSLLESPHYGERWGRHWLDVARYSDGFGGFLDKDAFPDAWRYATILHLMGLDHEKLTYRYSGRDFRLTDVHGQVVHDIIA